MKHSFIKVTLVSLLMLAGGPAQAEIQPPEILLFTDRNNAFRDDAGYPVIYLDEVLKIEDELTQAISHFDLSENMDPETMAAVKSELSQTVNETALLEAYAGLSLAWSLNITHIPAIVVRYPGEPARVIYGELNVPGALQRVRN